MSMIDNIAQIIARAYGGSLYPGLGVPGDFPADEVDYRAARAVIEALMEPTPEMIEEGCSIPIDDGRGDWTLLVDDEARRIWTAMLRSALNEGEGA